MFIADLHIHSRFSMATSRDCDAPHLDLWARRKGIGLLGTGDLTHPAWREELREMLAPAEEGLYTLKPEYRLPDSAAGPGDTPRFVLSGEISSIYKKNGRTRKVHNVVFLPSMEAAENFARRLERIGNIHSDGRPILGLDSRDLLEIVLESCPDAVFLPAHIWTPHFSVLGAFSGFHTIQECFEDLTPYIHALETGLSSDPPMNWRVSALDPYLLVSNSDAHSPQKLGREANLLDAPLSYPGLKRALDTGEGFLGTLEFFPEEGKYHLDGHRNCGVCLTPEQTKAYGGICPVCGKKVTVGVEHRVEDLADRPEGAEKANAKPFQSLAPLPEVIAACTGLAPGGKKVQARYEDMLRQLGPEFAILRDIPTGEIEKAAGPALAEGIRRLREGRVERAAGYDGKFGSVSLLTQAEIEDLNGQTTLFAPGAAPAKRPAPRKLPRKAAPAEEAPAAAVRTEELDPAQRRAAESKARVTAVIAGPGAGKTKTLAARIAALVENGAEPGEITAVTFTNRAAREMRERLETRLGEQAVKAMAVGTFHSICLELLGDVRLLGEPEALTLAEETAEEQGLKLSPRKLLQAVSRIKNGTRRPGEEIPAEAFSAYELRLEREQALDFDDLLLRAGELGEQGLTAGVKKRFSHLLVDEFQDVNPLQLKLVRQWSREGKSLFVIGDPDQSIYSFRGADSGCFRRLTEEFPEAQVVRLTENYRSTPEILSCALPAISRNPGGRRELAAHRPSGAAVRLVTFRDEFAQGIFLSKEIGRMVGGVGMAESDRAAARGEYRSFSEIAVLCRTHRQAELVEKCLRHDSIPCLVAGRGDFLEEPEVRDMLASLRSGLERGPAAAKESPLQALERLERERGGSENLEKLKNMAVFYRSVPAFLDALLLGEEQDLLRAGGRPGASGAVQVMTLHASKGLEFPVVFLCGLEKGKLPLESPLRPTDPEEERRLFFVGMTRAREELILLAPGEPSPLLGDIPPERMQRESAPFRQPDLEQLSLF